jgi:Helix-turn-helix domain
MSNKKSTVPGYPFPSDIADIAIALGLHSTERFFLYLIRGYINKKNLSCWPSQKRIALEMGITERHAIRVIKSLKEKGIISVGKRKARHKSGSKYNNRYRFVYPWKNESCPDMDVTQADLTSETSCPDIRDRADLTSETELTRRGCHTICNRSNKKNSSSSSKQNNDDEIADNIKISNRKNNKTRKGRKPSKFPPAVLEKKILAAIEKKGKGLAAKANYFADRLLLNKRRLKHPQSYKNAILESILRGEQADFEPECMSAIKKSDAKIVLLDWTKRKSKL